MDHLVALASIAALDVLAYTYMHSPRRVEHTRWCAIHAAANAIVVVSALPSVIAAARNPEGCLLPGATRLPVSMGMWLHAYHSVFYELSADDRMHHSVFVALLGTPSDLWARPATNVMLFFLSGLPGGLIYILLAARRMGHGRWISEPSVSFFINLTIRAPGMLWAACCALRHVNVPLVVLGLQITLSVGNALFYTWQSFTRVTR